MGSTLSLCTASSVILSASFSKYSSSPEAAKIFAKPLHSSLTSFVVSSDDRKRLSSTATTLPYQYQIKWFNSRGHIVDDKIAIPKYSVFCKERDRQGDGPAIFIKTSFNVVTVQSPSSVREQYSIRITLNGVPFIFCCTYYPSSAKIAKWQSLLFEHTEFLARDKLSVMLTKDFNVNLIADPSCAIEL